MIRQFAPGLWLDPELVRGVNLDGDTLSIVFEARDRSWCSVYLGDQQLADEIGTAARIAQEARLAEDTRLHREVPGLCPHREAADPEQPYCHGSIPIVPAKTTWPADDAGRPE